MTAYVFTITVVHVLISLARLLRAGLWCGDC